MAEAALVNEKVQAGEWLVRAADRGKVPLRAALWVYDRGDDKWTLALEERADATLGPREFARSLYKAVEAITQVARREAAKHLLLRDVAVFTSPHPVAQMLRPALGKVKSVARTRLDGTTVGGYIVDGAFLYRLEAKQAL
jgi:hypothetical protein